MSDMSGYIYGHMLGGMLSENDHVNKLAHALDDNAKFTGLYRDKIVDVSKTQQDFVCDDVGRRAMIRALTKELRFYSPFNSLLDKKNRDRLYVAAHDRVMSERQYEPVWLPQIANTLGLRAVAIALKDELEKVAPNSPLSSKDGRDAVYREFYDAEFNAKYAGKPYDINGLSVDFRKIPPPKIDG